MGLFTIHLKNELHRRSKIAEAIFLRLALTIGAWNFQTRCPKTTFA